jgi:sugar phosphate isomerase/epimerase
MVEFGSGYYMPMDREYGGGHEHHGHSHEHTSMASQKKTNDVGVSISEIGMSSAFGPVPNVHAMGAKVRGGSKTLEMGFFGYGKGSGQGQTPGMYGQKQRQALQEISKANKVNFTTHSSVGVYGLAGMDQQGNFSKTAKENSVQEIKRAVEFAADVGRGGPVVVHTGEFQRPVVDADWNLKENDPYKGKFEMYEGEEERSSYRVVDTRTGGVIQEARKNRKVSRPIWNYATEEGYTDHDGSMKNVHRFEKRNGQQISYDEQDRPIYLDYFGQRLHPEDRVPKFDKDHGNFMATQLNWDDLKRESDEMTARAQEVWKDWKSGKISEKEFNDSYWVRFKDATSKEDINVRREEAYIISTLETNAANSRGWAHYYGTGFDEAVESVKKLRKAYTFYREIEDAATDEERERMKKQMPTALQGLVPEDSKYPTEIIKERLLAEEGRMKQAQEASASQWAQADESKETIRHVESAETYALNEAFDAYAQSGISAMKHSNKLEKEGQLIKPIAVAMENLFPETYGAHPDELIKLVKGSRERMQQRLIQQGMKEEQAKRESNEHITATFDTGHMNMWRKYWKGDPNKTIEQNDKEFDKWSLKKMEDMVKSGIIGHVHLDDNYGYQDEHLAPGEGNAPIREMVKKLKELGYKGELIVEPGADFTTDSSGFNSVMKTWKLFGSPVYGAGSGFSGSKGTWGQVGYGWFGQNQPPYFTFGGYVPSEDWTLWSGVALE